MKNRAARRAAAVALLAVAAASAVPQEVPGAVPGGVAPSSIEMDLAGGARLSGRFPTLLLPGVDARLGTWLAGFVLSLMHETMVATLEALPVSQEAKATASLAAWERKVDYRIAHAGSRYLSLVFTDYSFTGGAHGNTLYHSFLFVRFASAWREASLQDLLMPEPGSLDRLSEMVLGGLRGKGAALVTSGAIKALPPEQLRSFTATPQALTFFFAPSDVGPYSDGPYEIALPIEDLALVVRPEMLAMLRDG
jgi:hypothetical protein